MSYFFPGNLDLSSLTLEGQFCQCCGIRYPINSIKEPSVVSRIIGFLKEKSLKLYIYRNLQLLSFPLTSSLPGFYRNQGVYEFFPEGHPRRWEVTLGLLFVLTTVAFLSQIFVHTRIIPQACCSFLPFRSLLTNIYTYPSSLFNPPGNKKKFMKGKLFAHWPPYSRQLWLIITGVQF